MKFLGSSIAFLFVVCLTSVAIPRLSYADKAPDFSLTSADGTNVSLSDFKGKVVVLEWFNAGCPFVEKHYKNGDMQKLQKEYTGRGVIWLTVNSTREDHQDYLDPTKAKDYIARRQVSSTHLLLDPKGGVGRSYGAKTTPDMFIVNKEGDLVYQGAIDDDAGVFADPSKANNYVSKALEEILDGKPVTTSTTKSYGCSVKYAQ